MIWEAVYAVSVAALVYSLVKYLVAIFELKKYPPGPFPLPLIGNLHLIGKKPEESFKKLSKVYGDVFSVSFGSQRVVVINSIHPGNFLAFQNNYIYKNIRLFLLVTNIILAIASLHTVPTGNFPNGSVGF